VLLPTSRAWRALLAALALAGCAAGPDNRSPAPIARVTDFRATQLRQVAVFVRVIVSDNSGVPAREHSELATRYESALLEGLDGRAVLVRDVHAAGARGPLPIPEAAAARAREVAADHALLVSVTIGPDVVRVCEDTRRPIQGRANVWKQDARVVRASDGAERLRVGVTTPDVEVECDAPRPAPRRRGNEATTSAAVERLLAKLFGP
jgi:hypothetical protein